MTGLEVLYTSVAGSISCPQDALVCFVHWELINGGYRCIGSGEKTRRSDKKSELLPADWSSNKQLYSLRYKTKRGDTQFLLKAISVDSTLIFNLMTSSTQQVTDLTVNISDHVNADHLHIFDRVFKDADSFSEKVKTQLLPVQDRPTGSKSDIKSQREKKKKGDANSGVPGILPPGTPGSSFDPFEPVGPDALFRSGPDPDHLPKPGYDDKYM